MAKTKQLQDEFSIKGENTVTAGATFAAADKGKDFFQQQGTASPEEQLRRKQNLTTRGRKGCKVDRINLALTPENYEYIYTVFSTFKKKNPTEFVNSVLSQHKEENIEIYEACLAIQRKAGRKTK